MIFRISLIAVSLLMLQASIYANTPKIYAVIVGVASYKDNTIPNLKFSEKDAKDFNDFLKSAYAGAVPEENIALLIGPNATRGNIITSMVNMSKRCTKDDMVIFYFSGHGEADEGDNSGYLLSYDAASENAPATAISMEEINTRLTKCAAKLKVSYVDACHAGMFTSSGKGSMDADNEIIASSFMQSISKAGDGNVAFLASSAKQQSQESDKLSNGVFYLLLDKRIKRRS